MSGELKLRVCLYLEQLQRKYISLPEPDVILYYIPQK